MNRRSVLMRGTAALVGTASLFLTGPQAMAEAAETPPVIKDMTIGDENAPVTIIEYASFTCPHCARFHDEVFAPLKTDYIDTGEVRFVYREVFFDRPGLWAAMVARCGGEMRYFGIVDLLFAKQRDWIGDGKGDAIVANLRRLGLSAGLTNDELDACLSDGVKAQALVSHFEANMKEYDIKGTPTLVINGRIQQNLPYTDLKVLIDAELAK